MGYSLEDYPAGNGTTATGDISYVSNIDDNAGIALFNTSTPANFLLANRLDAVGSEDETSTLYKEGAGYPALPSFALDASFVRRLPGGCTGADGGGNCEGATIAETIALVANTPQATSSYPQDTQNNAADFIFADTNGTPTGAGQRLGAPGPENLSSPLIRGNLILPSLLDSFVSNSEPPNRVRVGGAFCAPPNPVAPPCDPANESTYGTLTIRRTFTNYTGANVTRLRFRVVDITTFPAPGTACATNPTNCVADLRAITSAPITVMVDRPPCGVGTTSVTVQGTTLEEAALNQQPNGGAFNSTLAAVTVTTATPLPAGDTLDLQFVLGVQQMGKFRFFVNIEALP